MPHPIKTAAPAVFCLLAAALLLGYAPAATAGAMQGLAACGKIILPAVFRFWPFRCSLRARRGVQALRRFSAG